MQPQGPFQNGQPQPGQPGNQPYGPANEPYQAPYGPPVPGQPYFQTGAPGAAPNGQPAASPFPHAQIPGQPQQFEPVHPPVQPNVPAYQPPANYRPTPLGPVAPPPPPEPTTPYDFFMKPQQNQRPGAKKPLVPPSMASNKMFRIAFVVGGLVFMLIIASIVQAMLPKDTSRDELLGIAQTQTELARVADLGTRAKTREMRYFAVNSNLVINSDRNAMLNYMKKNGFAFKDKDLAVKRNAKTDADLKAATSSSTFDSSFKTLYVNALNSYGSALQARQGVTTGVNEMQMLKDDIAHLKLLLEQASATGN